MEKTAAHNMVRETLENVFQKTRFTVLLKNILNSFDESKARHFGGYVKDKFKKTMPVIKTYERLGTYTDPQGNTIDLLIVSLQRAHSIERARTSLRNFVADYLKQRDMKDAALVAFVAPNGADWRFSFVKMEYRFTDKGKVKEEFTPARRYSFLVGENENSHTAQSRLLPILLNDDNNPTLAQLEDAFSVEKVTNEFFEKYRDLFLRLKESIDGIVKNDATVKDDFTSKNIETADFAKKLLGQIVFLYFLQKKGWFGVARGGDWGSGSQHFLRELFDKKHGDYKNFFNDILEPLFYEALRLNYDRFTCRIPFLNGGLFDPLGDYDWNKTDIDIPNAMFSNDQTTKEGDTGDGVLDMFDRYNFTVKEDEPLEKEVAVDPEMLGKVFENLLAVSDRKSKGAYYTPREIVHYMCQESLINYLDSECNQGAAGYEKLGDSQIAMFRKDKKKQLDLTITHPPRPTINKEDIETLIRHGESITEHDSHVAHKGHETKLYSFRLPERIRDHATLIDGTLASIRVCDPAVGSGAFVVGMMHEIVRTRTALTPHLGTQQERSPYAFKRQAVRNCLYGVDIDPGAVEIAKLRLWLSLVVDEEERKTIQPLPNLDYKIVRGNSLLGVKNDLFNADSFNRLEELKPLYFNETNADTKQGYRKQIDELISRITDGQKDFDFEVYFSEVFHEKQGFDVVIGNPPYVQLQEDGGKLGTLYQREGYSAFARTGDIYQLFYEKGLGLARQERGLLTFITSNSWMRAKYGEKLRRFFGDRHSPLQLIDMGKDVFENVIVDSNILLIRNGKAERGCKAVDMDTLPHKTFPPDNTHWVPLTPDGTKPWSLLTPLQQGIKDKMERLGTPLRDWDVQINYGIKTGCNEAFIIDQAKRDELVAADPKSAEIIKPVLRGRDIQRYQAKWAGLYLLATGYDIDVPKKYPAIYEHLCHIESQTGRGFKRADQGENWWNLRVCSYYQEFAKEKLIWIELADKGRFAYDTQGIYCEATTFIMTGKHIKYLCAFLNSKIAHWFLAQISPTSGMGVLRWKKVYVEMIPVPALNKTQREAFVKLVDKILAAKKSGTDTTKLEAKIDKLVYSLYSLTEKEINAIEGIQ